MTKRPTNDEVMQAASTLHDYVTWMEEHDIRIRYDRLLGQALIHMEEADEALAVLESDTPLGKEYPDGKRAKAPYTPRQVFLLANRQEPITHVDPRYEEALKKVRTQLGRYGKRQCRGVTKDHRDCRNWALPYIERERCGNHATDEERVRNRQLATEEERMFHEELAVVGILDA